MTKQRYSLVAANKLRRKVTNETKVYVGLNDSETKEQKYETGHYISLLKEVCVQHRTAFSFHLVEGGYLHDDGEYTQENTIVLTLIDVPPYTIELIARDLCELFHQESVLVTTDAVDVRSIHETT